MPRLIFRQSTIRLANGTIQTDEPVTLEWVDEALRRKRVTEDLSPAQLLMVRSFFAALPLVRSWHLWRDDPAAVVAVGQMRDGDTSPVFGLPIPPPLLASAESLMRWAETTVRELQRPKSDDYEAEREAIKERDKQQAIVDKIRARRGS